MKIFLKVKPGSKQEKIEKISDNIFTVWVKEPPIEGRANEAVVKVLAEYFGVSKSQVRISHGATGRMKMAEVG